MQILFMRHGEAVDDIEDRYGGWADYPLTEHGREQISGRVAAIAQLGIPFKLIYTSPLLRAVQAADILGEQLQLPVQRFEFLKERNYYGVLSGMQKLDALEKYPDIVEAMQREEYVIGSERRDEFETRVGMGMQLLAKWDVFPSICVTHGNWLKAWCKLFLGRNLTKREDGAWMLVEGEGKEWDVKESEGVQFE